MSDMITLLPRIMPRGMLLRAAARSRRERVTPSKPS